MTPPFSALANLSDDQLHSQVMRLAFRERQATADLIGALMELDRRRLYLGRGYPSLFAYCTRELHLSEHGALNRIEVARAARRLPKLLELIVEGALTVTGARLLAPHLTAENFDTVLASARYKSKREVEEIVAALRPLPPATALVRKLPAPKSPTPAAGLAVLLTGQEQASTPQPDAPPPAARRPTITPLTPERFKVQFTVSRETRDKLRRAQDLLRHTIASGDPAAIFDRALTVLLKDLERTRLAATERPRQSRGMSEGSRHIPAAVKREVWARDSGQCAFIGSRGRCTECGFLELHHVVPFAAGGSATVSNIQLRCRAHNAYEASLFFGPEPVEVVRERAAEWV